MASSYLNKVRDNSNYPAYRTFISIVGVIVYLLAGVVVIAGLTLANEDKAIMVGALVLALVLVIVTKILTEMSLMLSDIADSVIEMGGRTPVPPTPKASNPHQQSKSFDQNITRPKDSSESTIHGKCGNCHAVIPINSKECPNCKCIFGEDSAFSIFPLE